MSFQLRRAALDDRFHTAQIRENQARHAETVIRVESVGTGGAILPDPITFDTAYTARPSVTHGVALLGGDPGALVPLCSGGVYRWVTDERGFYTGAWVFVRIETPDGVTLEHSIIISGPAYKVLGERAATGLDLLDLDGVEEVE